MTTRRVNEAEYTAMNDIDQTDDDATDFRRAVEEENQDYPGTRYYPNWSRWFGYYKNIPELHAVVDNLAAWAVGRGYELPKQTFLGRALFKNQSKEIIEHIDGCGVDSFNTISKNMIRTAIAGGDGFGEITRNKRGEVSNVKPINPGSMVIVSNRKGVITCYEQVVVYTDEKKQRKKKVIRFKPKQIFHIAFNRMGDEPHGRPISEALSDIIDAKNEAMKDLKIVFHRYVKPLVISKIDTDDETEINTFKTKLDKAVRYMENMVVPKDAVEMERMSIPQYSTLDPLPWIKTLQEYFIGSSGVPEVIMGYGRETTEAAAKILYLAFQQTVEDIQLWYEEACRKQLGLEIEFNFPENIGPEMAMDVQKERNMNNMSETNGGNLNAVTAKSKRTGTV